MTPEQHAKETTRLKSAITRARNAVKALPTLAEKIEAKNKVRELEDQLHDHKLNYFELVSA
ncbi:hypothetical protein PAERUG_P40_Scotland_4_VIM_2_09_12_04232 [Pseudomonas aeruginosa]|nr:hypothetical protein [Pseudomonas aeruginosa]CRN70935.1 hypothetical protein PAERUG_P40_Scotland_4_VIM_2_09_12_04232 [Pseudomonas aeruginosa]